MTQRRAFIKGISFTALGLALSGQGVFATVPYPWQQLMNELVNMNYSEWILWECSSDQANKVEALINQRKIWEGLLAKALK